MTQVIALPSGFRLVALETTESTNDDARRLADEAAGDDIVIVWSREQTKGRGRRGRGWTSKPGNLYCSFLVRYRGAAARAPEFSFVAGLSAAEAIAQLLPPGADVTCKWPNDVLVGGRKTAGILLETRTGNEETRWLIAGIGINVEHHPTGTPYPVTSLAAEGAGAGVEQTLEALAARFAAWRDIWQRDGFGPVRETWLGRAAGLGETATVELASESLSGTFSGLDTEGALLLDTPNGPRRITAGDVYFAPSVTGN
jgi:BirA family biotin operon repressor/biotin-[acetyl-CoA-carboxylase] ligase